jgi:hypothetical protein
MLLEKIPGVVESVSCVEQRLALVADSSRKMPAVMTQLLRLREAEIESDVHRKPPTVAVL